MQKTNVVPLYQKLVHENAELDKNEATIADLAIPPNAVIEMVAFDQGMEDLVLSTLQGTPCGLCRSSLCMFDMTTGQAR